MIDSLPAASPEPGPVRTVEQRCGATETTDRRLRLSGAPEDEPSARDQPALTSADARQMMREMSSSQ
jgi:hypothetical protein